VLGELALSNANNAEQPSNNKMNSDLEEEGKLLLLLAMMKKMMRCR
jgi:hypothetical protein